MRLHLLGAIMAMLSILPIAAAAQDGPSKAELAADAASWTARGNGQYLDAAEIMRPLAFDPAGNPKPGFAYDRWAEAQMLMIGERPRAPDAKDEPVPAATLARLAAARPRDAIAEIVVRARDTRIVILNEDHGAPRDRAFGLEVAKALRPLGYDVIAIETLNNVADDAKSAAQMRTLMAEGYPRHRRTGYYTADPVFGDFLRQSLALGYRPVAYESTDHSPVADTVASISRREQAQADYLLSRALKAYPQSKLFVYVGFDHATEAPQDMDGKPVRWLATRVKAMTGIDPLTIDQVTIAEHPSYAGRALYAAIADRAKRRSIVLEEGGEPLVIGPYAGLIDLQVIHPRTTLIRGRPDWLAAMGRTPTQIPIDLLPKTGARLIQAFVEAEAADAIPIDQVLVTAGETPPVLLLPQTPIRYAFQDPSINPAGPPAHAR